MGELNRCHDGEQDGPGGKDLFQTGPFVFPVIGRHLVFSLMRARKCQRDRSASVGKITKRQSALGNYCLLLRLR
jgi:hypothetical protein